MSEQVKITVVTNDEKSNTVGILPTEGRVREMPGTVYQSGANAVGAGKKDT
mgnify:CR=1 FL=1